MSLTEIERSDTGRVGPADDRPLTQAEQQIVQRFLSDPFSFPIQFKTWLVSFLESSDVELPIGAVSGLKEILGVAGVGGGILGVLPAGLILPFGGSTAPNGSLLCDGASYSRASFTRLYTAIGTKYGSVDANSFNVPNLKKKVPVGVDTSDVDFNDLGKEGGEKLHTLTASEMIHWHGSTPVHPSVPPPDATYVAQTVFDPGSGGTSGAAPHNNMQPYTTVNYIIVA